MGEVGQLDATHVAELLRHAGLRATSARRAIVQSLASLGHATPEAIFDDVHDREPTVNQSTVYRTLDSLAAVGLVSHAHLTSASRSYYLAGAHDHAHLVCESCGEVSEVPQAALDSFVTQVARDAGFAIDTGHLAIHGRCARCTAAAQATSDGLLTQPASPRPTTL